MRLAIDIDSTLHPYWDQLAEIAKRRFDVELPYETQYTWAIDRLTPEQLKICVQETHRPEHVLAAEPYPGAVEAITQMARSRATSSTSPAIARPTPTRTRASGWTKIGLPHDELYCSYDKITRCVEIGIDVLIDDSPVNLESAVANGITAATIEHPWNRDLDGVIIAAGLGRTGATASAGPRMTRQELPAPPEHRAYLPAIEPERQVTDWGRSERVENTLDKTLYEFLYHYWFRVTVGGDRARPGRPAARCWSPTTAGRCRPTRR